jgi:hypothetical protein
MLLLALRSTRNIEPFALVGVPAISRLMWRHDAQTGGTPARSGRLGPILRTSLLAVSVVAAVVVVHRRWTMTPPPAGWIPVSREAAAAVRGCPGPIYNHYDVGGFLIWAVPEQKVFLDSRQDPYPVELIQAQYEAERTGAYRELLDRYGIRCAVVEPRSLAVPALCGLGWRETYRDKQWVVINSPTESARADVREP